MRPDPNTPGSLCHRMDALLRAVRWLLLGGWLGSWALFALVIAPTAFRVLPSGEAAGALVGPVLRTLHLYGLFAGLSLFAIAFAFREGWLRKLLPALLALICALTEFGVSAEISEIRPSTFGLETPHGAAGRFSELHFLSRFLFGTVLVGVALLTVVHAQPPAGPPRE